MKKYVEPNVKFVKLQAESLLASLSVYDETSDQTGLGKQTWF